ncbi:MAG: enoyl-CoA hydratase/isomerase family protein [Chromatiales bacterium]|jgi:enoyl-CoA hydratase|nr:enoyl-CoA hydratase/isomerase family protein [Chromatiales bacterium]
MSDVVLTETRGQIRRITMNRPTKLNAMNADLVNSMVDEITAADADDGIAVIVLAGAGRAFSAGADISKSDGPSPAPREVIAATNRSLRLYKALLEIDSPIICEVHGYALGGGCNIAVCSDLVVAAENAVFGYPEVKVGLAATTVAPPIAHRIGQKAAFELLTLCENISAARALELGMINRVVPNEELTERTMAMAEQLASFDHDALWMTKQTIRRSAAMPLIPALEMARDLGLAMKVFDEN